MPAEIIAFPARARLRLIEPVEPAPRFAPEDRVYRLAGLVLCLASGALVLFLDD